MTRIGLFLLAAAFSLTACQKSDAPATADSTAAAPAEPAPAGYTPIQIADSSQITELAPGIRVYVVERGSGVVPKAGQTVIVNYHGTFEDGRIFDSSYLRREPFSFTVGQRQVIQGWDVAMTSLPVGTRAKLLLAPEAAYGAEGRGEIPPNTPLVFDIQILGAN